MVLLFQVLFPAHCRSAISSQVTVDPTRSGRGDVMPLSDAITQLSFLVLTPIFQDVIVQTIPFVSTQTSQDTFSCDVACWTSLSMVPFFDSLMLPCKRLDEAPCLSMCGR